MKSPKITSLRDLPLWVFAALLAGTAVATFLVLMLYQNIVERQAEATKDVFRVVEVDDRTIDPAVWGKNYPRQYDSYKRTVDIERTTHGGSDAGCSTLQGDARSSRWGGTRANSSLFRFGGRPPLQIRASIRIGCAVQVPKRQQEAS